MAVMMTNEQNLPNVKIDEHLFEIINFALIFIPF